MAGWTLPVSAALAVAGVLFWGATGAAVRRRAAPAAGSFAATLAVAGAGALALSAGVGLGLSRAVVLGATALTGILLPIPWLVFALEYTGRDEMVSLGTLAAVAAFPTAGLAATVLVFGSQLVPWLRLPARASARGLAALAVALLGLVEWLALLYAGGLVLAGSGLLVWTFHRYEHLDPTTGTLLGVFGTVPWLTLLLGFRVAGVADFALPAVVAGGFAVGSLSAAAALVVRDPFRTVPAAGNVGPATVIDELDDGVVVADREGTVVELNGAAERALDAAAAEAVGADVTALLDADPEALDGADTVALRSADGRRLFAPSVSELADQHGRPLGYAVVLRDVTARTTRRQRLEVLNRVLRHNLGNDMSVVLGHAERLRADVEDPELTDSAAAILRKGRELAELGDQAREVDQLVGAAGTDGGEVHLAPLVEGVLEDAAAEHPGMSYRAEVPPGVVVEAPGDLLELALEQLVENAVEHNDAVTPYVAVTASHDPGRTYPLVLSVLDDGPGVPETEVRTIQSGSETALQHASGLGLWVVRWTATQLGGELAFEDRDPSGTAVTLRLPNARRQREAEPRPAAADGGERDGNA